MKNFDELPLLLSAKEAAAILSCHPRTVARLCEKGELRAVKVGAIWRVNRDALLQQAGLVGKVR